VHSEKLVLVVTSAACCCYFCGCCCCVFAKRAICACAMWLTVFFGFFLLGWGQKCTMGTISPKT